MYSVAAALQKLDQAPLRDGQTVAATLMDGDSYLALGPPAVQGSSVNTMVLTRTWQPGESVDVTFSLNSAGYVSLVRITALSATSFEDAEIKARETILPILSYFSLKYDVPVIVAQLDVTEASTNILRTSIRVAPKPTVPLESQICSGQ